MAATPDPSRRWPRLVTASGALLALLSGLLDLVGVPGPWIYATLGGAVIAAIGALLPASMTEAVVASAGVRRTGTRPAPDADTQQLLSELEKYKRLERELTASKQSAEAATMAKGEFLATMSHEIRTPLNGIIPLLDILMSTPLGPDQREYVQTAFGSAKQLLRIVDDILDYSKLEANKLELETVGLNLKDVVESVMRLMDKAAEGKGLALSASIDASVRLAVRGDPVRLRQVLTNLLSNAIKFTERGQVSLTITRRSETRTHHELRFEVRDTGVGIAADAAAKLFQPFSQADASTTRTYGGTGLGLVICKRIVDLMGGQIGVESVMGRGSLFWFQVPMLKAHGDITGRRRELNGARVLMITASAPQQRRFLQVLPSWGANVVHAANTHDALTKLRAAAARGGSWSIDLLLVDGGSIPSTLLALHRAVMREASLEELQVIYLRAEEDIPAEIGETERVRILNRDLADADLRQMIERCMEGPARSVASTGLAPVTVAPAAEEAVPEATTPANAPQRRATLAPDAPIRGHVLLVEDNPVNRQVAQRLLSLAGLTLDSAENGREALDRLGAENYDAVLMDCQMPVMDGYTATRQRRTFEAEAGIARIPIIAMTANAMVGDREKCLASGMDDYLSKPLNRALLEETLRRWLPATPATRLGASGDVSAAPASNPAPTMPGTPAVFAARPPSTVAAAPRPATGAGVVRPAAPRPATITPRAPGAPGPRPTPTAAPVIAPVAPPAAPARPAVPARPAALPSAATRPAAASAPAAASGPALNLEIVDDLREIMGEEFLALVKVFLEDAPLSLARLEQAAARGEVDALVGPAHSLKSTSANLGAMALSDLARHIEHGARQRNLADPASDVAALAREFRRVEAALRGFLG